MFFEAEEDEGVYHSYDEVFGSDKKPVASDEQMRMKQMQLNLHLNKAVLDKAIVQALQSRPKDVNTLYQRLEKQFGMSIAQIKHLYGSVPLDKLIVKKATELNENKRSDENPYNDDGCPHCGEHACDRCRCSGPHTIEMLKKGHGLQCKNGHRWSGNLSLPIADDNQQSDVSKNVDESVHPAIRWVGAVNHNGSITLPSNQNGERQHYHYGLDNCPYKFSYWPHKKEVSWWNFPDSDSDLVVKVEDYLIRKGYPIDKHVDYTGKKIRDVLSESMSSQSTSLRSLMCESGDDNKRMKLAQVFFKSKLGIKDLNVKVVLTSLIGTGDEGQLKYTHVNGVYGNFVIEIDNTIDVDKKVRALAHELIHVEQLHTGMLDYVKRVWNGQFFDKEIYWKRPWESDARVRSTNLWIEFNRAKRDGKL